MRNRCKLWMLLAVWAAGCNGDTGTADRPGLTGGDFGFFFEAEAQELTLQRGDDVLLRLPGDTLQLGRVDALSDEVNYDPWPLLAESGLAEYEPPEGLRWLSVASMQLTDATETSMRIALAYMDGKAAELSVEMTAQGSFRLTWTPAEEGADIAYFRLRPEVGAAEGFYGLGAYLDHVNHRGMLRAMQMELDLDVESGYNEAHVPVPFVIGTRGWGLFVRCPYPGVFDLATEEDNRIAAVFGTGPASTTGLEFHLFAAGHPLDVTKHYYEATGYPLLPAPWALGPWIWRDENRDQAQVIDDINTIRDLDLATTGIWVDRPYASGVNSFDFEPGQFPDPDAMIAEAHDLGFRFALWHTPYADPDDPDTAGLHAQAVELGYFPPRTGAILAKWGPPVDFTNPGAYAWWQDLIHRYTDMGVEGFKLDYAEEVVPGLFGARNKWEFHDGSDERTMHALYQPLYHRVYAETLPDSGGFLLCRSGTYGDQVNVSVIWPGDLDANMVRHREEATNHDGETYVAVGGLPASLAYALSLGPSGFPFYGSDTGGYRNCPPDKETFTRWFEQTALSSVMQVGTSCNDVAWEFLPGNGFDEEMLGWYREYVRLHLRLWPYLWTLAQRIAVDGRPLMRPLGLAFPELGEHPDDIYLLGDELLVAPVVDHGARVKTVVFPPGHWVDWWTGEVHAGDATVTVDAPLSVLPLYLRAGGIVPMLRPTIDTLAPTGQPDRVDSYADSPGVLYVRVATGDFGDAGFTLFDGTELSGGTTAAGVTLGFKAGNDFQLGMLFEVVAFGAAPASVDVNGVAAEKRADLAALETAGDGWAFDPATGGTVFVMAPAGDHQVAIHR